MTHANEPLILGIESSCDDTSAAVIRGPQVLSNVVANQALHAEVGGVVPEWASRAHLEKITQWCKRHWTRRGGQIGCGGLYLGSRPSGSLHVGTSFAKAFAWALGVPSISVHHMRAMLAHVLEQSLLSLPVSVLDGERRNPIGESQCPRDMEVLGQTLDDAAGEAFDKVAKLMACLIPADRCRPPCPTRGSRGLCLSAHAWKVHWSFSGLTQVLHF